MQNQELTQTTLIEKVAQWGVDKGITGPNGKGTHRGQYAKFLEEMGELFAAIEKDDVKEIRDALGDLQVVAIQACVIKNGQLPNQTHSDWLVNTLEGSGMAIDEIIDNNPFEAFYHVRGMAVDLGHDPDECLQEAYKVISKRTGTMVGGTFVKHSN